MDWRAGRTGSLKIASWPRPALPDLVFAGGAAALLAAVLLVFASPVISSLRRAVTETAIRGNAATVQLAVESYAAAHQGVYPADVHAVLPWLPGARPPANPATGRPVEFRPAAGDVSYRCEADGRRYVIEAWAADGTGDPRLLLRLAGRAGPAGPAAAGL